MGATCCGESKKHRGVGPPPVPGEMPKMQTPHVDIDIALVTGTPEWTKLVAVYSSQIRRQVVAGPGAEHSGWTSLDLFHAKVRRTSCEAGSYVADIAARLAPEYRQGVREAVEDQLRYFKAPRGQEDEWGTRKDREVERVLRLAVEGRIWNVLKHVIAKPIVEGNVHTPSDTALPSRDEPENTKQYSAVHPPRDELPVQQSTPDEEGDEEGSESVGDEEAVCPPLTPPEARRPSKATALTPTLSFPPAPPPPRHASDTPPLPRIDAASLLAPPAVLPDEGGSVELTDSMGNPANVLLLSSKSGDETTLLLWNGNATKQLTAFIAEDPTVTPFPDTDGPLWNEGAQRHYFSVVVFPGETRPFVRFIRAPLRHPDSWTLSDLTAEYHEWVRSDREQTVYSFHQTLSSKVGADWEEEEVLEKAVLMGIPFIDMWFLPGDTALGPLPSPPQTGWDRPAAHHRGDVGAPCYLPQDIEMGCLGDRWLIAAVRAVAEIEGFVERVVAPATEELRKVGAWKVQHCYNGWWASTIVDDFFPMHLNLPAFASSRRGVWDLWVSVIEKAFAKLAGSYAAICEGLVEEALTDLTGCAARRLRDGETVYSLHKKGYLVLHGLSPVVDATETSLLLRDDDGRLKWKDIEQGGAEAATVCFLAPAAREVRFALPVKDGESKFAFGVVVEGACLAGILHVHQRTGTTYGKVLITILGEVGTGKWAVAATQHSTGTRDTSLEVGLTDEYPAYFIAVHMHPKAVVCEEVVVALHYTVAGKGTATFVENVDWDLANGTIRTLFFPRDLPRVASYVQQRRRSTDPVVTMQSSSVAL